MMDTEHEEWLKDRKAQAEQLQERAAKQEISAQVRRTAADEEEDDAAREKRRKADDAAEVKKKADRRLYI